MVTNNSRKKFDSETANILSVARAFAQRHGYQTISNDHALFATLVVPDTAALWVVEHSNLRHSELLGDLRGELEEYAAAHTDPISDDHSLSLVLKQITESRNYQSVVHSETLLTSLLRSTGWGSRRAAILGADEEDLRKISTVINGLRIADGSRPVPEDPTARNSLLSAVEQAILDAGSHLEKIADNDIPALVREQSREWREIQSTLNIASSKIGRKESLMSEDPMEDKSGLTQLIESVVGNPDSVVLRVIRSGSVLEEVDGLLNQIESVLAERLSDELMAEEREIIENDLIPMLQDLRELVRREGRDQNHRQRLLQRAKMTAEKISFGVALGSKIIQGAASTVGATTLLASSALVYMSSSHSTEIERIVEICSGS